LDYKTVRSELKTYNKLILEKPEYLFISKKDVVSESRANEIAENLKKLNKNIIQISIFDWESIELVKKILNDLISEKFDKNYYFGSIYSNYDEFLDWKKITKDLIRRFKFNSFLDIGCGCGNLVKEIKKQKAESFDVYGVDISDFAVRRADVSFVILADCQSLPFEDSRFDIVHILGTLSYLSSLKEIKQAIKEAYRVSKKIILFDDVYIEPGKKSDDYDPYRKQVFSQEEWLCLWKEIVEKNDIIETCKDEIIIKKHEA